MSLDPKEPIGVIVLPAYCETQSIADLLLELDVAVPSNWHFLVVDDSPTESTTNYVNRTFSSLSRESSNLHILRNLTKSGRGAAVQRGFQYAANYIAGTLDFFIEMDSDGSHTAASVNKMISAPKANDFVIGSRYLNSSSISGWPLFRRFFSKSLNFFLRKTFKVPIFDWTNGLRRYSMRAVQIQLEHEFKNDGFICLSEQIMLLLKNGISPIEIPITFVNRTHGSGSVTTHELYKSLRGILGLWMKSKIRTQ